MDHIQYLVLRIIFNNLMFIVLAINPIPICMAKQSVCLDAYTMTGMLKKVFANIFTNVA